MAAYDTPPPSIGPSHPTAEQVIPEVKKSELSCAKNFQERSCGWWCSVLEYGNCMFLSSSLHKSQISIQLFSTSPNGSWQHAQEYVPLFHVSTPYYGHVSLSTSSTNGWLTGISGAGANRCTASRRLRVQMQRVKKSWRRRWSPWRLHTHTHQLLIPQVLV